MFSRTPILVAPREIHFTRGMPDASVITLTVFPYQATNSSASFRSNLLRTRRDDLSTSTFDYILNSAARL